MTGTLRLRRWCARTWGDTAEAGDPPCPSAVARRRGLTLPLAPHCCRSGVGHAGPCRCACGASAEGLPEPSVPGAYAPFESPAVVAGHAAAAGRAPVDEAKYAICITTRGNLHVLEESLLSARVNFPHALMVIVSADAPWSPEARVLRRFARDRAASSCPVRLRFAPYCSRGAGRDLAFRIASAQVGVSRVIQGVDTDTVYHPGVWGGVALFEACLRNGPEAWRDDEGLFLQSFGWSVTTVALMNRLGGWPREQWAEDRAVWQRAIAAARYACLPTIDVEHIQAPRRRLGPWRLLRRRLVGRSMRRHPEVWALEPDDPAHYPNGAVAPMVADLVAHQRAYWRGRPMRMWTHD